MENDDIVEKVKEASPIEAIMEEGGMTLTGHGRYRRSKEHDSLVVDLHEQYYVHNSTGERGDVINWLEKHNNWDFKRTVEFLCQRAGLEAPTWGHQNPAVAAATRAREEALDVAAGVFASWLWRSGDAPGTPLAYARGRGWSDETIKTAGLGYTGDRNKDPDKKLAKELSDTMEGRLVDLKSPAALAVLGYQGDVSKLGIDVRLDWIDDKRIPSFWGRNMLVYTHRRGGRVKYLSGRSIGQKVHYNLPVELVGNKQPYFNHIYSSKAEVCVIVEGQADAISLAQWNIPAVALTGTAADEAILMALKSHQRLYVGLDDDKAGKMTSLPIMEVLGPMVRPVHWRKLIAGLAGTRSETKTRIKNDVILPGPTTAEESMTAMRVSEPVVEKSPAPEEKKIVFDQDISALSDDELEKMAADVNGAWESGEK